MSNAKLSTPEQRAAERAATRAAIKAEMEAVLEAEQSLPADVLQALQAESNNDLYWHMLPIGDLKGPITQRLMNVPDTWHPMPGQTAIGEKAIEVLTCAGYIEVRRPVKLFIDGHPQIDLSVEYTGQGGLAEAIHRIMNQKKIGDRAGQMEKGEITHWRVTQSGAENRVHLDGNDMQKNGLFDFIFRSGDFYGHYERGHGDAVEMNQPVNDDGPTIQLNGDFYKIQWETESDNIKRSVALDYLHKIIAAAGKEMTVADLRGDAADKIKADMRIRDDKIHDGKSLAEIRKRIEEIDDTIDEVGGSERLELERCELAKHLEGDDKIIGSPASATAGTIKGQMRDLWKKLDSIGLKITAQHLKSSIKWDGFSVTYQPAKKTSWKT